eukprot:scaffold98151_cov79-Phaeocystis_antarctica.AAC.3
MGILLEGANELGLAPAYVAELEAVVTQRVGPLLRCLAVHHFFLASALFRLKQARLVSWYSKALFAVYVPSSGGSGLGARLRRMLSAVATAALLAPTALIGAAIRLADAARGKPPPPMLAALMAKPAARGGLFSATRLISRALSHSGPHESTERHRGYFTHLRPPDSRGSEKRRSARAEVRGVPPRLARAIDSSDNDWFGQFEHEYKLSFVPGYCFMRRCGFAVPTTVQDQRAPGSIPEKAVIFIVSFPRSQL